MTTTTLWLPIVFWPEGGVNAGLLPVSYLPVFGSQKTRITDQKVGLAAVSQWKSK
jgi:hypothetical protein